MYSTHTSCDTALRGLLNLHRTYFFGSQQMNQVKRLPPDLLYDFTKDRNGPMILKPLPDKLFKTLCRVLPSTRLAEMPMKSPHAGQWKKRYEKYKHSKTFGEYIRNGALPVDVPYDALRGVLRFRGPFRKSCLKPDPDHSKVEKEIARYWYRGDDATLKQLYDIKKKTEHDTSGKLNKPATLLKLLRISKALGKTDLVALSNSYLDGGAKGFSERNLTRHSVCDSARKILNRKTRITDTMVLNLLRRWHFDQNTTRKNVKDENAPWIYSDNFGLLKDRSHRGTQLTSKTILYQDFLKLLSTWIRDKCRKAFGIDFAFTSICLNKNYTARRHKDKGNLGPSAIIALGDFKGGDLNTWSANGNMQTTAIRNKVLIFDGNCEHAVEPYEGKERYSLVFFTVSGFDKTPKAERNTLSKAIGVPFPTTATLKRAQRECISTCGNKLS